MKTLPEKYVEFELENNTEHSLLSIDANKWYQYKPNVDGMLLAIMIGLFGSMVIGRIVQSVFNIGDMGILLFMAGTFLVGSLLGNFLINHYRKSKLSRNQAYRDDNGKQIEETLKEKGWTLDADSNREDYFSTSSYLFVRDEQGVRYIIKSLYVRHQMLGFQLKLDDPKAEKAIEEQEKQVRIATLISTYEQDNGPMTSEQKGIFVAGLEMGL